MSEYRQALPDRNGYWWVLSYDWEPEVEGEILEVRMWEGKPCAYTSDGEGEWYWDPCENWNDCWWAKAEEPPRPHQEAAE